METLHPHYENDALLVDELLDFSCGDIGEGDDCMGVCIVRGNENEGSCLQNCGAVDERPAGLTRPPLSTQEAAAEAADSLYSPPDELAELDWLSSFVEESYKGADHSLPSVSSEQWFSKSTGERKEGCLYLQQATAWGDIGRRPTSWLRMGACSQILDVGSSPLIETPRLLGLMSGAQQSRSDQWDKRGRSKRCSRSGGRVWSLQRVMSVSQRVMPVSQYKRMREQYEDEDDEEAASSLDYEPYHLEQRKKEKKPTSASEVAPQVEGRRCSHCQVQKTPQWRAGPLGPKTLCNACGVRYKSGRLLPEYRPAASPTFISEIHSNSHKKVLEMRTVYKSCVAQERDQEEFCSCSQESSSALLHQ